MPRQKQKESFLKDRFLHDRFLQDRLKRSRLLFSFLLFTILSIALFNLQEALASPKSKSIFSQPKWLKEAPTKEAISEKATAQEGSGSESKEIKVEDESENRDEESQEIALSQSPKFFYPSQIKISPELGKIQESYQGKEKKLIIHLQDAHCHYEAQKKAAQMLEELIKNYGLRLVFVEGGSGDVSLSYLRSYGTPELREKVAEEYLKKGEIAGEEYLDIISNLPFQLYGIETDELYNAHLATFWKVEGFKEEALKGCENLKALVENLKGYIYNPQLKALEEKKAEYEKEKNSITDYYGYLDGLAKKSGTDLTSFPNFKKFLEAANFEKNIKSEETAEDCKKLVQQLTEVLPENKLKQLLTKSAKFKLEKIESADYYFYLKMLAQSQHINLKSFPYLYNYLNYLERSDEIDGLKLINEVKGIESTLKEKLFKNNTEKRLNEISENLTLLTNLINLQMTPDEYALYQTQKADFKVSSWLQFLNEEGGKYKLGGGATVNISLLENNLGTLEGYYQAALKRDVAMIENATRKMDEDGEPVVVLIAGGFHTPQLTRMLKEKDYSYIVVAPKITETSNQELYLSVLKNRKPLGIKE